MGVAEIRFAIFDWRGGGGGEKNSAPSLALTVLVSARTEIRVDLHYLWGVQGSIYNGMRVFLAWGGGGRGEI